MYLAVDESLGRQVALKVLRPDFARSPEAVQRLFNEARAVNLIVHPGLVQISEFGQMPDGSAYLVMEYLDGETLTERLIRGGGRMAEAETIQLVGQVASALATAHSKGVVHRDLKPSNIMVIPDPAAASGERAKLVDFGIAKLSLEAGSGEQPLTRTGLFMGTPLYMSPEQCRGARNVDGKSDVYSLGVLLFQLLAGRPPFTPDNEFGVIAMHLTEPAPPLSKFAPHVSAKVVKLVGRMLAKKKEERPTMEEVTQALLGPVATHPSGRLTPMPGKGASSRSGIKPLTRPSAPPSLADLSEDVAFAQDTVIGISNHPSTLQKSVGQIDGPSDSEITPTRDSLIRSHSGRAADGAGRLVVLRAALVQAAGRLRQKPRLLVAIAAGVPVLLIGLVLIFRSPSHPVATPPPRQQPARVRWSLGSLPDKAAVVRESDGAVLGSTPWQRELPASPGVETYVLRMPGYRDGRVTLDRSQSTELTTTLKPAEEPPVEPKPRGHGKSRGSDKPKSHGKTLLVD